MSNLIVTIISIALVAVAALMGAYYGGSAFLTGTAKAKVNQVLNAQKQIAAAWQMYALEHGGSKDLPLGNTSTRFTANLVSQYLESIPGVPSDVAENSGSATYLARAFNNFWNGASTGPDLVLAYVTKDFCIKYTQMINNHANNPARFTATDISTHPVKLADCIWHDKNNDSVMDEVTTDAYVAFYKAF